MSRALPKVLFITSTRIGDCVLSSGLLPEFERRLPGARVTVACGPLAAPLFRAAPMVERVHVMAKKKRGGHWIDLWRMAVGTRWDLVVDIRGSGTAYLLRASERIVYRRADEAAEAHKVVEASRLVGAAPLDPVIWLDAKARAEADALIGPDRRPVLAVAPVAAEAHKTWPRERFAELVRTLKTRPSFSDWRVMVVGGPGDREAAAPALEAAGADAIDAVGRLDILAAAAALGRASLFVGNDSGTMHLSAAMKTPTLALFGPTDSRLYGPWGAHTAIIKGSGSDAPAPMEALTVGQAAQAVEKLRAAGLNTAPQLDPQGV